MLRVMKAVHPDEVVLLGDFADFYAVQMHGPRDPSLMHSLKSEADDVNVGLDEIEAASPNAKRYFLEGNHEFRLERFLIANALPIYGICSRSTTERTGAGLPTRRTRSTAS
jgi:UDP-2,3-diacylglucosamine pyrophosphatase LpxH